MNENIESKISKFCMKFIKRQSRKELIKRLKKKNKDDKVHLKLIKQDYHAMHDYRFQNYKKSILDKDTDNDS